MGWRGADPLADPLKTVDYVTADVNKGPWGKIQGNLLLITLSEIRCNFRYGVCMLYLAVRPSKTVLALYAKPSVGFSASIAMVLVVLGFTKLTVLPP